MIAESKKDLAIFFAFKEAQNDGGVFNFRWKTFWLKLKYKLA